MSESEKGAVSAGRGALYIAAAKVWFIVAGFAIEFGLPRILKNPNAFGEWKFVAGIVSILNAVVISGTVQAISRFTAERPEGAAAVRGSGFQMHLLVGLPIAILYAISAPFIGHLAHDPGKTPLLAISAVIFLIYSFYCVFVGSANGQRHFHKQAGLDATASSLRALAVLGAAIVGLGVMGSIIGWAGAAIAVFLVAAFWVGLPRGRVPGLIKPMLVFLFGVGFYLALMQLLQTSDQLLLKRLAADWFRAHPEWLAAHSEKWSEGLARAAAWEADGQVGIYGAVQGLARLPYQLMITATFIVFPLVSRATFEGDAEKARSYIRTTLRWTLVFASAMGTAIAVNPEPLLRIMYGPVYAEHGTLAASVLASGNIAFALFTIGGTVLNAAGRWKDAVAATGITVIVLLVSLWVAVPRSEPTGPMLLTCAVTTAAAMLLGTLIFLVLLWKRFGAMVPLMTVVRCGAAAGAAFGVSRVLKFDRPLLGLAETVACGVVFLVVLVATRELGVKDLRSLRRKG